MQYVRFTENIIMKLEIAQKSLATLLVNAYKAISNRPNMPILSCFLFQADMENQQVIVTGFDGSLGIKTHTACKIYVGGIIAVNAGLFCDVVVSLHEQLILEITSNQLTITHSTGKCRLATSSPNEFPEMPTVAGKSTTLSVEVIKSAIASTLPFAARNELKQVLAAIHLKLSSTAWEAAATDGHRLGVACNHNGTEEFDSAVTIPHATVTRLKEIFNTSANGNCQITIADESLISFQLANICLTSRLLDQQYPNYRVLIPQQFDYRYIVNKNSLSTALNRVVTLAGQEDPYVQITFSQGIATLYAEAADLGGAVESVATDSTEYDTDFTIGFNIKYLAEAIKAINSSEIIVKANAPAHPVILSPLEDTHQFVLIMPVQLKQIKEFTEASAVVDEVAAA